MFFRHPQELLHDQLMEEKAQPPPLPDNDEGRIDITHRVNGATFRLQAKLASNRVAKTEPLTDIHVEVSRKVTNVIFLPAADSPNCDGKPQLCYTLPAFLVKEPPAPPFSTTFPLRASLLCSPSTASTKYYINWILSDIRIDQESHNYLVSSMLRFLCDVVTKRKKEGFEFLTMHISVTIEYNVKYECGAVRSLVIHKSPNNFENDIRVEKEEKDLSVECAVCFEEVKQLRDRDFCCRRRTSRWGVQLWCSHVFHLRCIAPWLTTKDSCPMCRRVQQRFPFGL